MEFILKKVGCGNFDSFAFKLTVGIKIKKINNDCSISFFMNIIFKSNITIIQKK